MRSIVCSINQCLYIGHNWLLSWMFSSCLGLWCFCNYNLLANGASGLWQINLHTSIIVLPIELYNLIWGVYWVKKNQIVWDINWLCNFVDLISTVKIDKNVILKLFRIIDLVFSPRVIWGITENISRFVLLIVMLCIYISLWVHGWRLKRMIHFN